VHCSKLVQLARGFTCAVNKLEHLILNLTVFKQLYVYLVKATFRPGFSH